MLHSYVSIFGLSPFRAAEIFQKNQKTFPLLRLPAELRDKIYHYAMEALGGVIHVCCRPDDRFYLATCSEPDMMDPDTGFSAWHPLNQACRQLRAEVKILRYTMHTYEIHLLGVGGLVALLPRPVLDAITVLRVIPGWFTENIELYVHLGVFDARLFRHLPNLKRIVLLEYTKDGKGYAGIDEKQRLRMKEAVMTVTGQDLEVV